jgi:hypothetical protein
MYAEAEGSDQLRLWYNGDGIPLSDSDSLRRKAALLQEIELLKQAEEYVLGIG